MIPADMTELAIMYDMLPRFLKLAFVKIPYVDC
jgi:hypothetical protein